MAKKPSLPILKENYRFYSTIGDTINIKGFALSPKHAYIGIEIENESKPSIAFGPLGNWSMHSESSLRFNGLEFVSKPLDYNDLELELNLLFNKIKETYGVQNNINLPWTNSIRTSTHVHFDVTQLNWLQLYNFVCIYWLLEPIIGHYCGSSRLGNLFCLRLKDSLYIKNLLSQAFKGINPISCILLNEEYRYASVNFNAITKFGTIEFRLMRGVRSPAPVITWVNILESIRQYAIKFNTPLEFSEHFLNKTQSKNFLQEIFSPELITKIQVNLPEGFNIEKEIQDGFLSVHNLLNTRHTWEFKKKTISSLSQKLIFQEEDEELLETLPQPIFSIANNSAHEFNTAYTDTQANQDNFDQMYHNEDINFYHDATPYIHAIYHGVQDQ